MFLISGELVAWRVVVHGDAVDQMPSSVLKLIGYRRKVTDED